MSVEQTTDWLPGFLGLGAATVGALVYLFGSNLRSEAPALAASDDLDARYRALLEDLRTHVANQHLLPPAVFARERSRLEEAAARTLRARDDQRHEDAKTQARAARLPDPAPPSALKGAMVGGTAVAVALLVGWQLSRSSTPSEASDPPSRPAMQAAVPAAASPLVAPGDVPLETLLQRARSSRDDADAQADLALRLLLLRQFEEARAVVRRAAALDARKAKVRVGTAVLRALDGDPGPVVGDLEALSAGEADAFSANLFAAMISMDQRDSARALKNLDLYLARAPPAVQPPLVRQTAELLRAELAAPRPVEGP